MSARKANAAYVRKDPGKWKNAGWTSQPNGIIRDEDIPPDECWAWAWLASHDENFEVSGKKLYEAKKALGRNRAYELLSSLERRGLLLRHHEYDPEAGVPYVQYELQPVAVPEDERTWEPSKAKPRQRGPHPGSKAAQAKDESPVDNPVSAGRNGFPTGRESSGGGRIPDRAGIRSDQYFPDRPGGGGRIPDRAGTPLPDRSGIRTSIEKKTLEEQKDTGQPALFDSGHPRAQSDASPVGSLSEAQIDAYFDEFYASYPRKAGRKDARRKFASALKDRKMPVSPRELIDGARRYAEAMTGTSDRFVKHPSTWLHQGCWSDEQPKPEPQPVGANGYRPYQDPIDPAAYYADTEW